MGRQELWTRWGLEQGLWFIFREPLGALTPGWRTSDKVAGTAIGAEKLGQPSPRGQQPRRREFPSLPVERRQEVNWGSFTQYLG